MHDREALWLAHQRRRWMLPDPSRWLQPDQSKWSQPDQARFQPPQPYERKYAVDQPRVPAGVPEGGQWTSGEGGTSEDLEQSLGTAADQPPRDDLPPLQDIANDPAIRSQINDAWTASAPNGRSPQEHGFWISRNETTGEIFTRPFANAGSSRSITPGPTPSDAVAFFHTHPNRPDFGFRAGPSGADVDFAATAGLPGLLQSHNGMYYFGPSFRPWKSR